MPSTRSNCRVLLQEIDLSWLLHAFVNSVVLVPYRIEIQRVDEKVENLESLQITTGIQEYERHKFSINEIQSIYYLLLN